MLRDAPLLTAFSSLPHFLTLLHVFPGITFQMNYLHSNPCPRSTSEDLKLGKQAMGRNGQRGERGALSGEV